MPGAAAKEAADRLIAAGNRAEDEGRLAEACARYREAVAAAPGYAKSHLNLGIGLEALGRREDALEGAPVHPSSACADEGGRGRP